MIVVVEAAAMRRPLSRSDVVHGLLGVCAALVLAAAGCDDDAPAPAPPKFAACTAAIQPYSTSADLQTFAPSQLTWHDGTLYALSSTSPALSSRRIQAVGTNGTSSRVVVEEADIDKFWVEGSTLLYAAGVVLRAVPLAGGSPSTVVDGTGFERPPGVLAGPRRALDGTHFYVTADVHTYPGSGSPPTFEWMAWRAPRAGGAVQTLGTFRKTDVAPGPDNGIGIPASLVVTGDHLIAADHAGNGWVIPKAGGSPVQFANRGGAGFVTADSGGVLWYRLQPTAFYRSSAFEAGEPELVWPTRPSDVLLSRAWSDGAGGWFVSVDERDSYSMRATLWRVPLNGEPSRVA